jgi:hypothetical protein
MVIFMEAKGNTGICVIFMEATQVKFGVVNWLCSDRKSEAVDAKKVDKLNWSMEPETKG